MNPSKICFVQGVVLVTILAALTIFSAEAQQAQASPRVQAWVGARIIDGTGKPAIENATLIVRDGQIKAVGRKIKIPSGAEKIDATGKTIIPGLICAHCHLNDPVQFGYYLRDGITTIFSLGGATEFALREQSA
jgi:cytosine/adenosine deaminase-related metal-dependent hydrolase